jgi:hypothetical protein
MSQHSNCKSLIFAFLISLMVSAALAVEPSGSPKFSAIETESVSIPGFTVVADRRVFAMTAFMLAMGFDSTADESTMHPARLAAKQHLNAARSNSPEKFSAWKSRYDKDNIRHFVFLNFSLALSPEYPFRCVRRNDELEYRNLSEMRKYIDILNDFWVTANLSELWINTKPEYEKVIKRYDLAKAERKIDEAWEYVRMPRKGAFTVVSIPNIIGRRSNGLGAKYGDAYWIVESPGAIAWSVNVHEYLHSIVNSIIQEHAPRAANKLKAYYKAGKSGPYSASYQKLDVFTYECLVRAIDARLAFFAALTQEERDKIIHRIADENSKGLNLAQPFYDALPAFEASGQSLEEYMPTLLEALPEFKYRI